MHTTLVRALSLALVPLVALAAWALPAAASHTTAATTTVHVVAAPNHNEFSYKLSTKTVAPGTITFSMTNTGTLPHDIRICTKPLTTSQVSHLPNSCATGVSSATISPGSKATTVKAALKKAGFYEYLCTLPGHAAGGMKGALKVT
jgi:plastocyanin